MHSLDGAYARVERAREHLTDLKSRIEAFKQRVVVERTPQLFRLPNGREVMGVLGTATVPFGPIEPIFAILTGEIIYNMRASLDYLIYELARSDSGYPQKKTQFPIDDNEKVFDGRRNGFLRGISDDHVAAVKALQPCTGCQWTRLLRDLSNPDKHMHLTVISRQVDIAPRPGSTEAIIAGQTVDVHTDIAVIIAFGDGAPVVESLEQLLPEVTQALDLFKPEFKM